MGKRCSMVHTPAYLRVKNSFQPPAGSGVFEHHRSQRRTVEVAVSKDHIVAKRFGDTADSRFSGSRDFTRYFVGVKYRYAEFSKTVCYGGLARADSPGECDLQHVVKR